MSILFPGVDDYATATAPITSGPLTMAVWVKPNATSALDYIATLANKNNAAVTDCFSLRMAVGGQVEMVVGSSATTSTNTANTTSTMQTTAWNHAAMIITSSTSRRVVLNGNWAESGTSTVDRTPTGIADLIVGCSPAMDIDGTPQYLNEWNGYIGHLAIWSIALSQAEIESLAAGADPSSIQSGSLEWYAPMTSSGSPGTDSVGGLNLTLGGDAVYDASEPTISSGAVTITDAGDEAYLNGETGITITGTGFGATQGTGFVRISPTDNKADGSAVTQTVNGWGDTSINFTAVRGSLPHSTNLYLFVEEDTGNSNASGRVVQFNPDRKLKVLVHSSAQSATDIKGVVFAAPVGSAITGTEIGEFTGQAFSGTLESGQAVLKVLVADFGGSSLTTSDTPVVLVRNATNTTGIISATIIEE